MTLKESLLSWNCELISTSWRPGCLLDAPMMPQMPNQLIHAEIPFLSSPPSLLFFGWLQTRSALVSLLKALKWLIPSTYFNTSLTANWSLCARRGMVCTDEISSRSNVPNSLFILFIAEVSSVASPINFFVALEKDIVLFLTFSLPKRRRRGGEN